jgi:D-sedoheptulose 7-phosphate isomerase
MSHARTFLDKVVETARRIEPETIETLCNELASLKVFGIVGRDGGYARKAGDVVVVIPTVDESRLAFQAVVWHCLVSYPKLQGNVTKW